MPHGSPNAGAGTLAAFARIRRVYRNWPAVLWAYLRRRDPPHLDVRGGERVWFGTPPSFDRWLAVQILPRLLDAGWRIERIDETHGRLSHPGDQLQFVCRFLGRWSDIIPLVEVYVDKVYAGDYRGLVVLDVGMADGDSSIYFARNGAARVLGVEPIPESYTLAVENVRLNGLVGRVIPLQGAVLSGSGSVEIQVPSNAPNRSSVDPGRDRTEVKFDRTISVKTYGVPEILAAGGVDHIDLVKMDCEGCEYSVLTSLHDDDFTHINRFVLEYHDGPRDLPKILAAHGFTVTTHGEGIGYLEANRIVSPATA